MAAIITPRFRVNNVQGTLNEMVQPSVMIANMSSSGQTISTPGGAALNANVRVGMKITLISVTSGSISSTVPNLVTAVGTNSFTVQTAPSPVLIGATLGFTHQYYVGIGKGDPYAGVLDGSDAAPGVPLACPRTDVDTRNNLIALKRVVALASTTSQAIYGDAGFVVPRYTWASNTTYKAWDPTDPTCFYPTTSDRTVSGATVTLYPCYATSGSKVFVCVASGYDQATPLASQLAPVGTVLGTVTAPDAQGYSWVYAGDIGLDISAIATPTGSTVASLDSNQYFKVYSNTSGSGTSILPTASSGSVNSIRILAGGTGYSSGTFRVDGDTTISTASGTFVASGGAIVSMTVTASGAGYTSGTVTIVTGTGSGAVLLPRIAPKNGFGHNAIYDLPAWFAGFYASFPYDTTDNDIPIGDTIRQVSLIRNAIVIGIDSPTNIYGCLKTMTFTTSAAVQGYTIVPGDVIEDVVNGARAFVDDVNGAVIKYHQNSSEFGTSPILQMNTLSFGTGVTHLVKVYSAASGYALQAYPSTNAITSLANPLEYTPGTGEVIFVEQRAPITQNSSQSEAISIILQF